MVAHIQFVVADQECVNLELVQKNANAPLPLHWGSLEASHIKASQPHCPRFPQFPRFPSCGISPDPCFLSTAAPAEPRGEKQKEKLFFVQILGGEKLLKFVEKCR